mmetsp:Transcript_24603/g.37401  ORF Transcript_24603/g.37401 Transcript_24603/m.37401 type:complete len:129 (-) Transcript_24603:3332-3718(-)
MDIIHSTAQLTLTDDTYEDVLSPNKEKEEIARAIKPSATYHLASQEQLQRVQHIINRESDIKVKAAKRLTNIDKAVIVKQLPEPTQLQLENPYGKGNLQQCFKTKSNFRQVLFHIQPFLDPCSVMTLS